MMKVRSGKNQFLSTVRDNCKQLRADSTDFAPDCCGMHCQMLVPHNPNFIYGNAVAGNKLPVSVAQCTEKIPVECKILLSKVYKILLPIVRVFI